MLNKLSTFEGFSSDEAKTIHFYFFSLSLAEPPSYTEKLETYRWEKIWLWRLSIIYLDASTLIT